MKYLTTILFLLIPLICFAPAKKTENKRMSEVEFLFYAVCIVESNLDSTAVGKDNDRGIAQITPILELDYFQRTGQHINPFSTKDSERVFMYYAEKNGPQIERIAKKWNGAGPKTEIYWKKVKREFDKVYYN
jgi:hypothetical protein